MVTGDVVRSTTIDRIAYSHFRVEPPTPHLMPPPAPTLPSHSSVKDGVEKKASSVPSGSGSGNSNVPLTMAAVRRQQKLLECQLLQVASIMCCSPLSTQLFVFCTVALLQWKYAQWRLSCSSTIAQGKAEVWVLRSWSDPEHTPHFHYCHRRSCSPCGNLSPRGCFPHHLWLFTRECFSCV